MMNSKHYFTFVSTNFPFQVFEANFSTTTPNDRLVSQLILMSSVQKYFNFNTYIACGIPEVELLGTEEDWRNLIVKLQDIKKVLSPIAGPLGNITAYFDDIVAPVYQNLLNTFLGKPDKVWWNDIVLRQAKVEQVQWNCNFLEQTFLIFESLGVYQAKESGGTLGWLAGGIS